jgi:wyosine [tRNA(Phe)-imidazoG37] synthetase (radical SAM superfamily)
MEPRKNKSKEELVEELKQQKEVARQKMVIETTIFPSLHDSCKTIADAKALLEYASSIIQQKGLERMYKTDTKDLDIVGMMKDTPEAEKYKAFFHSFDSFDVGTTITVIDQLKRGITNYVENKVDAEPLTSAKIEEIINKKDANIR